jgi:hypothetical protein
LLTLRRRSAMALRTLICFNSLALPRAYIRRSCGLPPGASGHSHFTFTSLLDTPWRKGDAEDGSRSQFTHYPMKKDEQIEGRTRPPGRHCM